MTLSTAYTKLSVIRNFLSKGPEFHWLYFRWKLFRVLQRVFPFSYRRPGNSTIHVSRESSDHPDAPVFFFSTDISTNIPNSISTDDRAQSVHEANRICELEFSFRQAEPFRFETEIDWFYSLDGNKDWRWDLNRHAYFETLGFAYWYTGDEKYARAFANQLESWIQNNPPHIDSLNWSSVFEVGYRINSWTWAFFLFKDAPCVSEGTLQKILGGIEYHCQFLAANLELHAQNNHLILEAKALLLAAILFPKFQQAHRWEKRARRILYRQIREQVHPDGVHGEMSTHYHRVITGELLELLALHRINNVSLPEDILSLIRKMVEYEIAFTRPDHKIPLLGDSSQRDTYARFSAAQAGPYLFDLPDDGFERSPPNEAAAWRLARFPTPAIPVTINTGASSLAFPDGGCYLMRCGRRIDDAMYLNIDCGPFGLKSDPHHGHADALSIDLFAKGRSWIVDSGVYSTHSDWAWRRYFRGTRSHSTVVVDELDQSTLLDSRRVIRTATAICNRWITSPAIDFFAGTHNGYERLDSPITHRRKIWFVRNLYWLILDSLIGDGEHDFQFNYQFQADLDLQLNEDRCQAVVTDSTGRSLTVAAKGSAKLTASAAAGQIDPVQGWRSENSGQKSPAETLTFFTETTAPLHVCTIIFPAAKTNFVDLRVDVMKAGGQNEDDVSVSVRFADWADYFLDSQGTEQGKHEFADFSTDARVAFVRRPKDEQEPTVGFCDQGSILDKNGNLIKQASEILQ